MAVKKYPRTMRPAAGVCLLATPESRGGVTSQPQALLKTARTIHLRGKQTSLRAPHCFASLLAMTTCPVTQRI